MTAGKEIIINDFHKGIGESPHTGFAEMRFLNTSVKGQVTLNDTLVSETPTAYTNIAFTATAASDTISYSSGALGTFSVKCVRFSTTTTLPAGLSVNTDYWLKYVDETSSTVHSTYALAAKSAGTTVDITDTGTGTHTLSTVNPSYFTMITSYNSAQYAHDANGIMWKGGDFGNGRTWEMILRLGSNSATGIGVWKDYLWIANQANLGYYGKLSNLGSGTSVTFDEDWQTTLNYSSGGSHQMLTGQDGILYWIGGSYVGSLLEIPSATFDPTDSATYNFNNNALDFPTNRTLTCLAELGIMLAFGTNAGIYAWDRTSPSFQYPTLIGQYINAIIPVNNLLYCFVGDSNDIYVTDLSNSRLAREMPREYIFSSSNYDYSTTVNAFGVCLFDNKILFSMSGAGTTTSVGVYSFDPETKTIQLEYGYTSAISTIYAICAISNTSFVSSFYTTVPLVCSLSTVKSTSYAAYFITPFYQIGNPYRKKRLSKMRIVLGYKLGSGQAIKISARTDMVSAFTSTSLSYPDIITWSYDGKNQTSKEFSLRKIEAHIVQFKVEITTEASSSTTPYLKEIRFS